MRPAPTLSTGDAPESRLVGPITVTDIVRFAGAGGDYNPLHHDEATAKAAGFESIIAMGQFTAGLLAGLLTDWVGIEHIRQLEVRFVSPLFVGDEVELSAHVDDVNGDEAGVVLVARAGSRDVVTGSARVSRRLAT